MRLVLLCLVCIFAAVADAARIRDCDNLGSSSPPSSPPSSPSSSSSQRRRSPSKTVKPHETRVKAHVQSDIQTRVNARVRGAESLSSQFSCSVYPSASSSMRLKTSEIEKVCLCKMATEYNGWNWAPGVTHSKHTCSEFRLPFRFAGVGEQVNKGLLDFYLSPHGVQVMCRACNSKTRMNEDKNEDKNENQNENQNEEKDENQNEDKNEDRVMA